MQVASGPCAFRSIIRGVTQEERDTAALPLSESGVLSIGSRQASVVFEDGGALVDGEFVVLRHV
jgi:hypothetical protein